MTAHQVIGLSLEELAEHVRRRALSSVEIVTAYLDRAEGRAELGAFITLDRDRAVAAAEAADAQRAGGALHGVPIAVKDMIPTQGLRTTAGSQVLHDWVPTQDAAVVAALRAAGGIVLGKTHTTEFAVWATGGHRRYAVPRNPWDPSRVPGGSSTGSAIAVAAGLAPAALGTDTGGSARIPAALCGVVGFKPTRHAISTSGVIPLSRSLDHVGVLARSVRDAAALFAAVRDDRAPVRRPMRRDVQGVRVGLLTSLAEPAPDVGAALQGVVATLGDLGATVEETSVALLGRAYELSRAIQYPELLGYHESGLRERPEAYGPELTSGCEEGATISPVQQAQARRTAARLMDAIDRVLLKHDVLLLPTVGIGAPKIGEVEIAFAGRRQAVDTVMSEYTRPFNLTGHPAISVPCGRTPAGLPIGAQLVGRRGGDDALLEVAHAYERAAGLPPAVTELEANPR